MKNTISFKDKDKNGQAAIYRNPSSSLGWILQYTINPAVKYPIPTMAPTINPAINYIINHAIIVYPQAETMFFQEIKKG